MTTTLDARGIRVAVARTRSEVEDIRSEWETLLTDHDSFQCVQNDPIRYLTELRVAGNPFEPHVVLFRDETGPKGIIVGKLFDQKIRCRLGFVRLPLMKLKCLGVVYGGIVSDGSTEVQDAIFEYLWRMRLDRRVDMVTINHLPMTSDFFTRLRALADVQVPDVHWFCKLGRTYDSTVIHQTSKHRRKRAWQDRKLCEQFNGGVTLKVWQEGSEVEQLSKIAGGITAQSYLGGLGVGYSDTAMWRAFLSDDAHLGRLRCYTLRCAGEDIAYAIGVVRSGVYLLLYTAFAPKYRQWSPGQVMLVRIIHDLCEAGIKTLDYGFGDHDYKQWFGNGRRDEVTMEFYGPTVRAQFAKHAVGLGAGVTARLKSTAQRVGIDNWIKRRRRQRLEKAAQS